MKVIATQKGEQNDAALDPWSAVHLSAGLAMGLMGLALRWVLVVSAAYEVFEQFVERKPWGKKLFQISGPESLPNALVDMVALLLGHHLGSRWNRTGKG